MGAILILDVDGNSLGIDCTTKDARSYTAKVTQKPIGNGVLVSDSRVLENPKFSIEGIISNTPSVDASDSEITITATGSFLRQLTNLFSRKTSSSLEIIVKENEEEDRVKDAHKFLNDLYLSQKTFSLFIKGFDEIDNLVVLDYKPTFTSETGESLNFTLEIQQIITVETKTTQVPKAKEKPKIAEKKNKGKEETKEVKPKEEKKSLAYKGGEVVADGAKKVGNFIGNVFK